MNTLGERLSAMRKQRGLSQEQVAKATGVTRAAVSLWEHGHSANLKHESLRRVAALFNITIDEMLDGKSIQPISKDQYARLLDAASFLKGWDTPAKLAEMLTRNGYATSPQALCNWKTRGLSFESILKCSRIIGCDPLWLEDGARTMTGPYQTAPSDTDLVSANLSNEKREVWLQAGRMMASA